VHGIGGIGKTQTALEYTYRFGKDYNYIFWVTAQTGPELSSSFSQIARNILPEQVSQDQKQNTELVRSWLEKCKYYEQRAAEAKSDLLNIVQIASG
jgi:hypothetical protein